MQLLTTQQELVALDLGMQAIAIRGAQVKAEEDRQRIAELEAKVAELQSAPVTSASPPQRSE